MKRRSTFLTGFIAAALTFASLMIFAGPQRFNAYGFSHSRLYGREKKTHCSYERRHTDADHDARTEKSVPEKINSNYKQL